MSMRFSPLPQLPHYGTYIVRCGPYFYIGSSLRINIRRVDHRNNLVKGTHHNQKLQKAYDEHKCFEFELVHEGCRKSFPEDESMRLHLRGLEQTLIDTYHGQEFCCNISTTSIGATNPRPEMKEKWQDPEFRARILAARVGYVVTKETRELMAQAKRGSMNPKSQPIWTSLNGERHQFDCVCDAARHHGVSQQMMDGWLKGMYKWPGSPGSRRPKTDATRKLVGLVGGYVGSHDPCDGVI